MKILSFFCDLNKTTLSLRKKFKEIKFLKITSAGKVLSKIKNKKFIIDENSCSIYFESIILKNNRIINFFDPIYKFKAVKTFKEIRNMQSAHLEDGVALTKYLFWIKKIL